MNQPLGFAIGNALEVSEAIETMKGNGPADFTRLCEDLGTGMLTLASPSESPASARARISELIRSGKALERFSQMVEAQGGNPRIVERSDLLPESRNQHVVRAGESGYLAEANARRLAIASMNVGAALGDPSAGLVVHKKVADWVDQGDPLCTIHYSREDLLSPALTLVETAFVIEEDRIRPPVLVERIIGMDVSITATE